MKYVSYANWWCSGKNIKAGSVFQIIQGCAEYWLRDYFCHLGAGIKRHSFKDKKQYEGAGDSCISQAMKTERVLGWGFFFPSQLLLLHSFC